MSSLGGSCRLGEAFPQPLDGLHRLVDRQRGLRQPHHLVLVAHGHVVDGVRAVHELDVVRRLAGGADDFLVALVADQQDVVVVAREALGLVVHLGDQRACGVDHLKPALGGRLVHGRRHTVGGEHDDRALGHLVGFLDEHRAGLREGVDDVAVVHDLVPDVHRRPVLFQRTLDGLDGAVDAGAVAARFGEQHPLAGGALCHASGGTRDPHVDRRRHKSQGTVRRRSGAKLNPAPLAGAGV